METEWRISSMIWRHVIEMSANFVQILRIGLRGLRKNITFNLSGIPDNALGRREERMFWIIVEAAATPHTVPMERKR